MEEIEKKNEAGSETSKEETKSRREFLKSAAIQGAVAALFVAVTFDSVMARAMGRVSENQSIRKIGSGAADYLHSQGVLKPMDYYCGSSKDFVCTTGSGPECATGFSCDGSNCAGGNETFICDYGAAGFTCDVFTCNPQYTCANQPHCPYRFVC